MNPKHVTDLELSKQLFEAGITKDFESEFVWVCWNDHPPSLQLEEKSFADTYRKGFYKFKYPALLLSELLEIMPSGNVSLDTVRLTFDAKQGKEFKASYYPDSPSPMEAEKFYTASTPLEALSSLATYLILEGKFNNTKHE